VDRVGERRAPRAHREKAGARVLRRVRKRPARRRRARALLLAGGEHEPKLRTATVEEAGRAQAAVVAAEVGGRGAERVRAGRAPAAAEGGRALEEAAVERAPAEPGSTTNERACHLFRWHALSTFAVSAQSAALPPRPMETPSEATRSFWNSSPPPKSPL
jgi:hypothetical protein